MGSGSGRSTRGGSSKDSGGGRAGVFGFLGTHGVHEHLDLSIACGWHETARDDGMNELSSVCPLKESLSLCLLSSLCAPFLLTAEMLQRPGRGGGRARFFFCGLR